MSKKVLPDKPIIIVDDEPHATFGLMTTLKTSSTINNIITFNDSKAALEWVKKNEPSMALLDIGMPEVNGIELLRCIKHNHPRAVVIMITAEIDIDTAVNSIKEGAFDYITKPINHERLFKSLTNGMQLREKDQEVERLRASLFNNGDDPVALEYGIISNDTVMLSIFNYLKAVAPSNSPILINGETGTGKEVIVKLIHRYMGLDLPLITCNVAGLDDHLFSDTLFGHVKGAFTGADKARDGLIVQAEGGILFLDEIGDLSLSSQVKLLRLLQEREYLPLGADKPKKCNIRVVAATHRNLQEKMDADLFRSDLFYRLGTHKVSLPPLRQRTNDIPLLFNYFLENAANEMKKPVPTYSRNIPAILKTYSFPGNIRELKGMVEDAVAKSTNNMITINDFNENLKHLDYDSRQENDHIRQNTHNYQADIQSWEQLPDLETTRELLIHEALRRAGNNQSLAARILGVTRQNLNQCLKRKMTTQEDVNIK